MNQKQRHPSLGPDLQLVTVPLKPLPAPEDTWTEVSSYLGEALRMERAAREIWLSELQQREPGLARQINAYITQIADLTQEEPPRIGMLPAPAGGGGDWIASPGQMLGAYTLERPIGHGGMGTVWLARRADGRYEGRVAIKLMNAAVRAHVSAERITREGQILARLSHPNIARLIDAGVTVHGQPYLVLEYVDGEEIDQWCNRNGLSIDERIRLFLDVLSAVQHAHNQLILHRDLKPSNILVTKDGGVRLLDFGIGKLLDGGTLPPDGEGLPAGRNTTLFCTPAYAAPEQVQSGQVSTTATDVYALGVLLYVLLVGRHPTTVMGSTPLEQMKAVVEQDAPRLSDSAASKVPPLPGFPRLGRRAARRLRGDLDNILAKALRKAPSARYSTVNELADDLRRYLDHKPVHARPDSVGYRLLKFVRRHRGPAAAAIAVFLALLGGVTATTWQAFEASKARALAESQTRAAEEERAEAQFEARNARANHELLAQIFGDALKNGDDPRMRSRLDRARDLFAKRYAQDPKIYANLLLQLASRYDDLGDQERETQVMHEFNRLSARTGDGSLQANAECIQAYSLLGAGQPQEAAGHVARGFDFMHQARPDWAEAGSECYRADAMLALAKGEYVRAARQMSTWLETLEAEGLTGTRGYLASLASLANILLQGDDLVSALDANKRVIELNEALGSDALAACVHLDRQAEILYSLGRLHDALSVDAQLEARMKADGSAIPLYMRASMARRALAAGLPSRTIELLKEVPALATQTGDEATRHAWPTLIEAHLLAGDAPAATRELTRYDAQGNGRPLSTRDALQVARLRLLLPLAYGSYGRRNPRLESARNALDAAMEAPGLGRVLLLNARITAGLGALAAADLMGARQHADAALAMAQSQHQEDPGSAWIGGARLLQARVDLAMDDAAEATAAFTEARDQLKGTVEPRQPWRLEAEKGAAGKGSGAFRRRQAGLRVGASWR